MIEHLAQREFRAEMLRMRATNLMTGRELPPSLSLCASLRAKSTRHVVAPTTAMIDNCDMPS